LLRREQEQDCKDGADLRGAAQPQSPADADEPVGVVATPDDPRAPWSRMHHNRTYLVAREL